VLNCEYRVFEFHSIDEVSRERALQQKKRNANALMQRCAFVCFRAQVLPLTHSVCVR
jgi:hypothetical protein